MLAGTGTGDGVHAAELAGWLASYVYSVHVARWDGVGPSSRGLEDLWRDAGEIDARRTYSARTGKHWQTGRLAILVPRLEVILRRS